MAKQPNFLLGNGHRLTSPVQVSRMGDNREPPYSFNEARDRLVTQFESAAARFAELPPLACPDGYAVGVITLHPEYTAKSYFPANLLREAGMEAIGSRPARVTPEKWKKKKAPEDSPTTELFVAARRDDFSTLAEELGSWNDTSRGAKELFEVEAFRAPKPADRIQKMTKRKDSPLLEVVLHTSGIPNPGHILEAFEAFAESLELAPDLDRRLNLGIPPEIDGVVRRGFVSSVRCSISAWCGEECRICRGRTMVAVPHDSFNSTFRTYERCIACHGTGRTPGHGPDIVARHPVERVEITGLEPMPSGPGRGAVWYWIAGVLPAGLIPHMNQAVRENPDAYALGSHAAFPTREDALVALSDAAIRWARAEAVRRGLVPDLWGAERKSTLTVT